MTITMTHTEEHEQRIANLERDNDYLRMENRRLKSAPHAFEDYKTRTRELNDDDPLARGAEARKAALIAEYEQRQRGKTRGPLPRARQIPTPDTLVPLHPLPLPLRLTEELVLTDKRAVLDEACHAGFVVHRGSPTPILQSLLDQGFLVKGIGNAYIITRVGRMEATDMDTPVTKGRGK